MKSFAERNKKIVAHFHKIYKDGLRKQIAYKRAGEKYNLSEYTIRDIVLQANKDSAKA